MDFDLILRGGHVLDPSQNLDLVADVGFQGGKVAAIRPELVAGPATEVRDVQGHYIAPGFIDLHTHVYWGGTSLGVDAERTARPGGVTTLVDAGSAGPGNFAGFRAHVIEPSKTRILAYLHVSFAGIYGFADRIMVGESSDMRLMAPSEAVAVAMANRNVIVGIKVRVGRHASGDSGIAPLDIALQAADQTGLPIMCHIDEPPPSYDDVLARLRTGDVLTHAFRPFPNSPLTGAGQVRASVLAARERGILFDIGHGMGSLSFDTARTMLAAGFAPDTISSDVHFLNITGPVFDQAVTLSKFLALGMPLADVIRATTSTPAKALERGDLGTLAVGAVGDATVFKIDSGAFEFVDSVGEILRSDRLLKPKARVLAGRFDLIES